MNPKRISGVMFGFAFIVLALVAASGCTGKTESSQDVQRQRTLPLMKATRPGAAIVTTPQAVVDNPGAASEMVGFAVNAPSETLGRKLSRIELRNNHRPGSIWVADLIYPSFKVREVAFEGDQEAMDALISIAGVQLDDVDERLIKRVRVRGHEGLAWNQGLVPPSRDSSGGSRPGRIFRDTGVVFLIGSRFYSITTTDSTIDYQRLIPVAQSIAP